MEQVDFRHLSVEVQEHLRYRAIYLVETEGYGICQTALAIGVRRQTVSGWLKSYRKNGKKSLKDGRVNTHRKDGGVLSPAEQDKLKQLIKDKNPSQLKMAFALWTAAAIRDLVSHQFGKKVSMSTVRRWMKKWGYTPQKPLKKAIQRDPVRVQTWLDETYPAIKEEAKATGAMILWGDESCIKNHDQIGRSYAPKGQTPVIEQTAKRFKTNIISAISNRGDAHFMLYDGSMHAWRFITFLKQLIRQFPDRKIILIVDNLRTHHAKLVTKFIEHPKVSAHLSLKFLPPYAPEHNPDEYLNNDVKQKLANKKRPDSKEQLITQTAETLNHITQNPHNIVRYFNHKHIQYAA